jgi:hypothetical protein
MTERSALQELIAPALCDAGVQWSMGTFGAIAEFSREPDEPVRLVCDDDRAEAVTNKGGLRFQLMPDARPLAYETINRNPDQWSHAVAFCLAEDAAAMNQRTVPTELGLDRSALRETIATLRYLIWVSEPCKSTSRCEPPTRNSSEL